MLECETADLAYKEKMKPCGALHRKGFINCGIRLIYENR